jgi:predicted DNA-binding protein
MAIRQTKKGKKRTRPRQPENAREAAKQYMKENQDIAFAVEAMRTARLGQQVRLEHSTRRIYRVFG